MKYIPLTKGKRAIVDGEDFEWLNQWKWHYGGGYVVRTVHPTPYTSRIIYLHREIIDAPKELEVDHKNGNTLDNTRNNLRTCFHFENSRNRKLPRNNTTGAKGIWWYKKIKRWQVYIVVNYRQIYLGIFKNKTDAAQAYNHAAKKYYGQFAYLNKI